MNNIFDIEKFNLIEDEENYYFFRSLEPGDLKDLENGIIKENNEYTRLRTDRERWEEEHPGKSPRWNSESEVSLEEMYSHIKMHYSLQTNCISLSSNANVARTYGEAFSDKYVMIRVPKKEMGERVFHAGPYMLQEIEKIVNKEIEKQKLREDVIADLKAIDEAKTSDEIKELIKTRYKSKEGIDASKAGLKKGIKYRSPHARISSYQSLNEEQTLEKNRIIGKLTVLEKKQAMEPLMARASSNNLLIQTVGSSFSSSEQIYYGDIEGDRITDISKEILDIFGILQQVEGQDKEIITELKRELIKFVNEKRQINISEDSQLKKQYNLKDNITIEEMYELTDGKLEYGIANSIVKNMFYLSKGQQEARQLAEILRNITNNNPRYEGVIDYIEKNGFEIEPKISTRQSNKGYRLSESVNLDLRTNEIPLVEAIKSLSTEEQIEILEKGGLSDTRNIITDTFSRVQRDEKISREEYYAGAIIDSYDWEDIGIEEFTIEQRNDLLKKLKEKDCVGIYKKLQDAGIPEKDIPLFLINIASKEQFSKILTEDNYIEVIRQNKEALSQELSIPQIETFLGYYNVEGTEIVLRDYQRNAVEKTDEIFEEKRFASVVLPTGAGKTFVALTQLLEHKNEPILYLAPQNEILEQTKDRITEYIHGKQGTIGKSKDEIIAEVFPNIKFETYPGLLAQRGKEVIENNYDFIVLDELHRTGAKEWEGKLNRLLDNQDENTKVLGITATPTRDMDDRNMADEMALKLGYTKEEVQRREHIAMDMDLVDAIKLGLVVNPKIVSCEYTLKIDGSMENLLEKINSIEDEDIRKEKIEQYEKLRRKIDSVEGIPEILKQNIKAGGKYIVFIPVNDKGEELEDEDGNEIGKKTGTDKIQEYEQKLEEYLKDSGLNPKCYSMLGAYSDKVNENQLKSFEEDDSEDAKFMIVMNKANEGLHIKGIDGIVWFRALDENSKILYLQQLGRAIYSEDPNNPTPDEKRPVIIDLANNTLKVNIDKDIKNNTRRSDLELLSIVVDWVKLHNGLPNIDSTNKIEQRYAATLYRIQNEYMKYRNGFEQFPDLDKEKKEEIDEILNKGEEIDLWDIELTPNIIQKADNLLEVNDFEVTGIMRDYVELDSKVFSGILRKEIIEFIKKNQRMPKRTILKNGRMIRKNERRDKRKNEMNKEEYEEANLRWRWDDSIERKVVESYLDKKLDEIPEEDREFVKLLREIGYGIKKKTFIEEMTAFIERNQRMPRGTISKNGITLKREGMTDNEIEEINLNRKWYRSKEKKIIEEYEDRALEEVPESYRYLANFLKNKEEQKKKEEEAKKKAAEKAKKKQEKEEKRSEVKKNKKSLEEEMLEFIYSNHRMPRGSIKINQKEIKRKEMTASLQYEVKLYDKWIRSELRNKIEIYKGKKLEELPENERDIVRVFRNIGVGKEVVTLEKKLTDFIRINNRMPIQRIQSEIALYSAWNKSKLKEKINKYKDKSIEEIPKEDRDIVSILRNVGVGLGTKTTEEKLLEFLEKNHRMPRGAIKVNGKQLKREEMTQSQIQELRLYDELNKRLGVKVKKLKKYTQIEIDEVPEEYKKLVKMLKKKDFIYKKNMTSEKIGKVGFETGIKNVELCDEEDKALHQFMQQSKEGGINKDEQS